MTQDGISIVGRIERKAYDTETLRSQYDGWDEYDDETKLDILKSEDPVETESVFNVTTDRFHEYFVDNLDPSQSAAKDNVTAAYLGVGTDGASGTATTDTDLNNRVFSKSVTDNADNGKSLLSSTFISSGEANGNDIDEVGLFSGDPANIGDPDVFLINHATFAAITKDSSKTITVDVTLQFSDT